MQISRTQNTSFKGFYNVSSDLEQRILWNRALVTGLNDAGWLVMANNKAERREKLRRFAFTYTLNFLSPIITLPISYRLGMRAAKLTNGFMSHNFKAAHISSEFLKNSITMQKGLSEFANKTSKSPLENLYAWGRKKLTGKATKFKDLDIKDLLDKCDGDAEKLRKKLINVKAGVLGADVFLTSLLFGSIGFVNNQITKKKTGMSGFSAEMSMADREVVEKRAQNYERTRKKRYAIFAASTLGVAIAMPLLVKKGLMSEKATGFIKKMRDNAHKFDYDDGIYMKRLPLLFGAALMGHVGTLMATRNNTELKDNAIRYVTSDVIFFGGDILLASLFGNISDKLFKTNLTKSTGKGFSKILPNFKSLREISDEVKSGTIKPVNKKAGLALYWLNMAIITLSMGIGVPKLVNAITKRDVSKDADMHKAKNIYSDAAFMSKLEENNKLRNLLK